MKTNQYISIAVVAFVASIVISACNSPAPKTMTTETTPNPATPATTAPAAEMAGMKHGGGKKININSAILSELDKLEAKLGVSGLMFSTTASMPP